MTVKYHLGPSDYAVLGVSLLVPVLMGLKFRYSDGPQTSTGAYFFSGRKAQMLPVVMSTTVSMFSAILMIGAPAESYRFGAVFLNTVYASALGQFMASVVFIPVYFRCEVSSIYELLEMRFGKYTRYSISAVFIIQTVLYMCVVLLAPVIALNAVTDFSIEMAIIAFGAICTFYCVVGGLKTVLWTDVFQAGLMFTCIIVMCAVGIHEVGGLTEITKRASEGQRLNFFDFRLDFETRYTFWNCSCRGFFFGFAVCGTSQLEVQRSLSMSGSKRAQRSLRWSIFPIVFLQISCSLLGVLLYAIFYLCDPVLMFEDTGITKYDQLVPYFIMSRLHLLPGLTGLCIAGIFSGSLSTMSSALNSLATVTVVDFIQPMFSQLTDTRSVCIAKVLGLLYGLLCIGITFAMVKIDSIMQANSIFVSYTEGPVLAIFLIGVLTRKASDKCAVIGLFVGVCLVSWIGFGTLFGGYKYSALSLETSGCPAHQNTTMGLSNLTALCSDPSGCTLKDLPETREVFLLYKMPFYWIPLIGSLSTVISVLIATFLLDSNKNIIPRDSKCLSPVVRYWFQDISEQEIQENGHDMKTESKKFDISEITHF